MPADESITWLKSLPAGVQAQPPVPQLLADAYMIQKDWRTLQTWLRDQKWEEQDFIRSAILTRAWRSEDGGETVAKTHWTKAVQSASDRPEMLAALANIVGR